MPKLKKYKENGHWDKKKSKSLSTKDNSDNNITDPSSRLVNLDSSKGTSSRS